MRIKWKVLMFGMITAVFCLCIVLRIIKVNQNAVKVNEVTFNSNETFQLKQLDITVQQHGIYSRDDVKQKYPQMNTDAIVWDDEDLLLVAEIDVKNNTAEEHSFRCSNVHVQSGAFTNVSDNVAIKSVNKGLKVKPDEENIYYTAIPLKKVFFTKKQWNNIRNSEYELVLSEFPELVKVRLS